MEHMPNTTSEKLAESVLLLAIARVSMVVALPTMGLIAFLGSQWLEDKFAAQDQRITTQITASDNQSKITAARIDTVEKTAQSAIDQAGQVNGRLSIVEIKQNETAAANEKFQNATLQRLDRVQDSLVGLSNAVSALTATLQTVIDNGKAERK